jgi:predicted glycoside hydrolase/deacetylase ChbG (UPF0249 family)
MCRENPTIDMGVHATLNAEWESYRWGPLSTREADSGLMDEAGYFHQWHQAVYDNARPEAVEKEVNAQIERAIAAGIDVTHVDSHMGTIMSPLFIQSYVQAASSRLLPSLLPRLTAKGIEMMGIGEQERLAYAPIMEALEALGIPMMDGLLSMPLNEPSEQIQMEMAREILGNLPIGITHFVLHPSIDTPELRSIAPDWESRVANYKVFMSEELMRFLEREDIKLLGYRALRNVMQGS